MEIRAPQPAVRVEKCRRESREATRPFMIASAVDREPATHPRNGSVVHSRRCGFESEDPPSDEKHIQLTLAIYAEAVDPPGVVRVLEQRPERKVLLNVPGHASHDADASDEPLEVREDESPTERGSPFTSVDIPAYDGRSYVVAVFQDWKHRGIQRGHAVDTPTVAALEDVPTEVGSRGTSGHDIQLLEPVLAHVGNVEEVRSGVEGNASRVSKPVHVDFGL